MKTAIGFGIALVMVTTIDYFFGFRTELEWFTLAFSLAWVACAIAVETVVRRWFEPMADEIC